MNANELIELLEQNAGEGNTPIRQAVAMLRQQQAEIEALKEKCKWYDTTFMLYTDERKAQDK